MTNRNKGAHLEPTTIPAAALFCVRHATIFYDLCTASHVSTQVGFRGERTGIVSDELRFPLLSRECGSDICLLREPGLIRRPACYQESVSWPLHLLASEYFATRRMLGTV